MDRSLFYTALALQLLVVGLFFAFAFIVLQRIRRRSGEDAVEFPPLDTVDVLFQEKRASGKSLESWLTRLASMNSCLTVTVTGKELWINSSLAMQFFAVLFDLVHRVPLAELARVEIDGRKAAIVAFTESSGEPRRVKLVLRERDRFVEVLRQQAGPKIEA